MPRQCCCERLSGRGKYSVAPKHNFDAVQDPVVCVLPVALVLVRDLCTSVDADIESTLLREHELCRPLEPPETNVFAIYEQGKLATLTQPATVICEVHADVSSSGLDDCS